MIYIKEGVYEEQVIVPKQMVNLTLFGDGSRKTIITGSRNVADGNNMTTYKSATVGKKIAANI